MRFYERREIRDVIAYLKLISNPRDTAAFLRIVNYPRRGIGDATLTALLEAAQLSGLSPLEAARDASGIEGIRPAGGRALDDFAQLIDRYGALAAHKPVHELLTDLIVELRLLEKLREEGYEGIDRAGNVEELVAAASDFDPTDTLEAEDLKDIDELTELDLFLQKVSLLADVDNLDPEADAVTLMTLHNAKGLEFPVVFIAGLEEGLFPLSRSYDTLEELEEERRLFYVGITRAQKKLYLTHARRRRRAGEWLVSSPSEFLRPLSGDLVESQETDRYVERVTSRRRATEWEEWPSRWEREREGGGGLRYDYSDSQDVPELPELIEGSRVRHPRFGPGTVAELDGYGTELKAVIEFDDVGRKKVVVRYANLELD